LAGCSLNSNVVQLPQDTPDKCLEISDKDWAIGYVSGEILLRFEDNVSTEQANKILADSGFDERVQYNRLATNGGSFWKTEWIGKSSTENYYEIQDIANFFEESEDVIKFANARGTGDPKNTVIIIFHTNEDIEINDFKKLATKYNFDNWKMHNNSKNVVAMQLKIKKGDEFKWCCYFEQNKFKNIVDYVHVNEIINYSNN